MTATDLSDVTRTRPRTIDDVLQSARSRIPRLTPAEADAAWRAGAVVAEGYTSSLAAVSLQDLGIQRATDVIGGYAAWRELR